MVAITIVTLAVAGPLFSADRAIVAAQTARAQLTASYLAQEGIEYVRRMRDNEYLAAYLAGGADISATAWSNFLTNPSSDVSSILECRAPKKCTLDPASGNIAPLAPCSGNVCSAPLYILSNGVYSQQNGAGSTETQFIRSIQAVDVATNDEQIVSTVSWWYHNVLYSVTVIDHLTPWQ